MAAALSIAARMAFQVVLASWQRRALAGQACMLAADIQPSARSGAENCAGLGAMRLCFGETASLEVA